MSWWEVPWIEREGASGYLETRLARRYPGLRIVVRNLGWTGDTVDGITRGKPNPPVDGFKQLVEHVAALKPTVILLGYGANESFSGVGGLPAFGAGLDRLWTALASTGAKIVVLTPTRQANLGPPWPDPTAHNADLACYGNFLKAEAARRGALCVDLFTALPETRPWTSNGLHLTPLGYWHTSGVIAPVLAGSPIAPWRVAIDDGKVSATGATVLGLTATPTGLTFQLRADYLPDPPLPSTRGERVPPEQPNRLLQVTGLTFGPYRLKGRWPRTPRREPASAPGWNHRCR